jgi:hypothetical protein
MNFYGRIAFCLAWTDPIITLEKAGALYDLFVLLADFVHNPPQITGQFQRRLVLRSEFVADRILHKSTQDCRLLRFGTNRSVPKHSGAPDIGPYLIG